jgi:ABC-2 type transport system ATP-binding protein
MGSAIRTENLTKKFHQVDALNGLNLDVPEGAIYALVGPNGAGKTTAIKVLMNILGPTSGHATVLGMDSKNIAGRAFRGIGYVSENQENPGWMRVDRFLAYLRPFYPSWDRDLERELVRQFDLPLDRKLKHLSRGMRMKAALASSLAYQLKLVVLDEPFSGLDPLVRDQLIEGMLTYAAEATVLVSSHDLAEVETLASHVGYLEQGRLKFSEEMTTLTDRFREVEVTFEEPPTLPHEWPESWMQIECSGTMLRLIESQFHAERTQAEIQKVSGKPRNVRIEPISLRAIFLAMAKAGRKTA